MINVEYLLKRFTVMIILDLNKKAYIIIRFFYIKKVYISS